LVVPLNTTHILKTPQNLSIDWHCQAVSYLDFYERQRLKHYTSHRKNTFLLGRWLLKTVVGHALKCRPSAVIVGITANGKPFIKEPRTARHLHISLTHAGCYIALGLTTTAQGIDIENIERAPSRATHIPRLINAGVYQQIINAAPTTVLSYAELFTLFWTYLETQVKIKGSTLYKERALFFDQGVFNPQQLSAYAPAFVFYSSRLPNYIVSYACWRRQSYLKMSFVMVKNTKKKSFKYDKMK